MILTCPACGTSYVVKDGAIPPHGRQVRCASCKHSWHQDAEVPAPMPDEDVGEGTPAPVDHAPVEAAPFAPTVPEASSAPGEPASAWAKPLAEAPAVASVASPSEPDPAPSIAPVEEPVDWNDDGYDGEPLPARSKAPFVLAGLVLLIAALAAAAWFLAPREWLARAGLREASATSSLKLMVTSQDRQKLASGNDLVSLSGRVINPTEQTLTVPRLQADLRDVAGKLVYSWTIAPPAARLPPQGSASFNAAELNVPPNATSLTLRWAS